MRARRRITIALASAALALTTACAAVTGLADYGIVEPLPDGSGSTTPATGADAASLADANGPATEDVADTGAADAPLVDAGADANVDAGPPVTECLSGFCEVITSSNVLDVATSTSAIYWLDSTQVVRTARLDGTNAQDFTTGEAGPLSGIEVTGGFVYWTAGGNLRRRPVDRSTPASTLGSIGAPVGCMKQGAGRLVMTVPSSGDVLSFSLDGTSKDARVIMAAVPVGVLVVGANLFYTNYEPNLGKLRKKDFGSAPTFVPATPLSDLSGPRCLGYDGTLIWYASQSAGQLNRYNDTTGQKTQAQANQTGITGISVGQKYVYWTWQNGIRRQAF